MKESDLKKGVEHLLQLFENGGKLKFQRNNSFVGRLKRADGSEGFVKNGKPGAPDYYVFFDKGVLVQLELKSDKGSLSDKQEEWQRWMNKKKYTYYVLRDLEDLKKVIECYL